MMLRLELTIKLSTKANRRREREFNVVISSCDVDVHIISVTYLT